MFLSSLWSCLKIEILHYTTPSNINWYSFFEFYREKKRANEESHYQAERAQINIFEFVECMVLSIIAIIINYYCIRGLVTRRKDNINY